MSAVIMRASVWRIGVTLAALFALAGLPERVAAQAIPSGLTVKRNVNGTRTNVDPEAIVYARAADCDGSTTFEFTPTLYSVAAPVVEAWLAVGEGKDCRVATNRTRQSSSSSETICKKLATNTDTSLKPTLSVNGKKLFDASGDDAGTGDSTNLDDYQCDEIRGSPKYYVYIIPLDTATTSVTAAQPRTVGASTLIATFTPYTKLPDAPTSLRSIDGDSELSVKYTRPSTANSLSKYRAYFDFGPSGEEEDAGGEEAFDAGIVADAASMDASSDLDATAGAGDADTGTEEEDSGVGTVAPCGSGLLRGSTTPPAQGTQYLRITGKTSGNKAKLADVGDISFGTKVAVAVTHIDGAGNESLLSEPTCVTRVDTEDFFELCDKPGADCGLESCGVHIGGRGSALALTAIALAAAALRRRRSA